MQTNLKIGDRLVAKESWRYVVVMSKHPVVKYWMEVKDVDAEHLWYDSFLWYQNGDIEQRKEHQRTQLSEVLREITEGHLELSS